MGDSASRRATLCRGRDAGYPAPPAQIPAGGFPAPGSSNQLAFAYAKEESRPRADFIRRWHKLSSSWQGTF